MSLREFYLKHRREILMAGAVFCITCFFIHYNVIVFYKLLFYKFLKLCKYDLILPALLVYCFSIFFSFLFLNFLGLYGVFLLCTAPAVIFWITLTYNLNYFLLKNGTVHIVVSKWFKLNGLLEIKLEFLIDLLSYSFMYLTVSIAIFVTFFAFSYFRYEPNVERLILLLNAFVLSMVFLVISGNLVLLFFGWEMIGLTSFLLINFWLTRVGTLKAAFKAYTFNKVSDVSLFLGLLLVYYSFNELTFSKLSSLAFLYNDFELNAFINIRAVELISFFFLTAAFIKSAQIGFHVWLPDSMEAPVPASALIHSATLVSAGIFLSLRLQPIFELSNFFHVVVPLVGALTAFLGGFGAFFQTDLKRVLAYSTISHCGFLFFLSSFCCLEYTIIYLYVHGFFKASSFLCVGNIIRFSKNYQDVRRMGFFWKFLPAELYLLAFCLLNLSGMPFFFGFLIKHFLFLSVDFFFFKMLSFGFVFLAAFSGIFYSFKIFFYVFFDSKKARQSIYFNYVSLETRSDKYSNSTFGGILAIICLVLSAIGISFIFFFWLYYMNVYSFSEINFFFLKSSNFHSFSADLSVLFNFKFLNTIVCIFFFFLNFFKWNKVFNFSYEFFFFIIGFFFFLPVFN